MERNAPAVKPERTPLQSAALALQSARREIDALRRAQREPLAIVGMGCRFPGGSRHPAAFEAMLRDGAVAISEVPSERWNIDDFFDPEPGVPGKTYSRWGGFLERVDEFDAEFFSISPREAAFIDPQQRLTLEVAWEALEDAGQAPTGLAGSKTGVFIGASGMEWAMLQTQSPANLDAFLGPGCALSIISNRLSYLLDLRGPSVTIDTACSSSLVAVHMACQSLRRGEANLAIAGGVNLIFTPSVTIALAQARMLSPTGRCHTFDAAADGYVRGEGCGIVVLKRLSDAVAAGDRILAVIRGSAVNQDGKSNGLTAPNGLAQESVIRDAIADAGVNAASIGYVEAHGTGTSLGDPVEVEALWNVLGRGRDASQPLLLGSVKASIGHLESAAGVAGLIKTVLAIRSATVFANPLLKKLNPLLTVGQGQLEFPTASVPWSRGKEPLRAGVSSFGFGGTNAHLILEEAPAGSAQQVGEPVRNYHLLALSAKTKPALDELARDLIEHVQRSPELSLADVAFTLNSGRTHFRERLAVVARSSQELGEAIKAAQSESHSIEGEPRLVFLFTGQGSQYVGMGRELYASSPVFREALNQCQEWLRPLRDRPLLEVLYARDGQSSPLNQTEYTQPALFALQFALAELWRSWGIRPAVVLGHSVGEFAAACVAGVMTPQEGLRFIAERGRLMQSLPAGGVMAAVFASEAQVRAAFGAESIQLSIAARNGPNNVVISGPEIAVASVLFRLSEHGVKSQRLVTSHAFHSPLMEPILNQIEQVAATIEFREPAIDLISNLTGAPLECGAMAQPSYWRQHTRQPVDFEASIRHLAQRGPHVFVEIGPSATLLGMARRCWPHDDGVWLPSLRANQSDWKTILESLAALYTSGCDIHWAELDRGFNRQRLSLPTYPFQRRRHWNEAVMYPAATVAPQPDTAAAQLFYRLSWRPVEHVRPTHVEPRKWIIIGSVSGVGGQLRACLNARGRHAILVEDAAELEHRAFDQIDGVVLAWGADDRPATTTDELWQAQGRGCQMALKLAQQLAAPTRLWLVTRGSQEVAGRAGPLGLQHSALWGFGRALGLERPEIWGGLIDLDPNRASDETELLAERLLARDGEDQIAFRDGKAFIARLEAATPETVPPFAVQSDGCYLITGGTSGLGLAVAQRLFERGARHLLLVSRRGLTAAGDAGQTIEAMRADGATVVVFAADVADQQQMAKLADLIDQSGVPLRGVVHAAGVGGHRAVGEIDAAEFEKMLRPKLLGGWNLDRLTRNRALDFFVCFSSISAIWGSAQQTHYAAANATLDALAVTRRLAGRPALSIAWGPWAEIGMMPEESIQVMAKLGVRTLTAKEGLDSFEQLLGGNRDMVVVGVNWDVFAPVYEAKSGRHLFDQLLQTPSTASNADRLTGELLRQLDDLQPFEKSDAVLAFVRHQAAQVLRLEESRLPNPATLAKDLGFDSLLAVELGKRLGRAVNRKLPATLLFEHPTIADVASYLCREVLKLEQAVIGPAKPLAIPNVQALSEDEIMAEFAEAYERLQG